eukprot:TRINITY_DN40954_c0_g2_i1.p1 TRINITY_DN40954_c0_g2~~TRINITY_DN40954_c0_g2_i1.p1  ORF type:complete len:327 (-),score=69.97 TRINITY_DN40954_c0_g2_i1:357-1199(-)
MLGVGAYALVYEVRERKTSERFAMKVVEKGPLKARDMLPQLYREIEVLEAHTDTPHIAQTLATTESDTHVFMRFELCKCTLEDLIVDEGPMSESQAFGWLRQVCLGLQVLHDVGVVHRDLKPSNFLIDAEDSLRICDFGWSCREEDALTGACGTMEYASPECQMAKEPGPPHSTKCDIYGLGACLQHFLLGRPPMHADDVPEGLSMEASSLLAEMLDADPEARPTVEELLWRPSLAGDTLFAQLLGHWQMFLKQISAPPAGREKKQVYGDSAACGFVGHT